MILVNQSLLVLFNLFTYYVGCVLILECVYLDSCCVCLV